MFVRLLGTAAGGGVPQWNCCCNHCTRARADREAHERLHASLAISASGRNWYLIDATPDIRLQIESFIPRQRDGAARQSPIQGIFLTDAELDHTIGLLVLRESAQFKVFATKPVLESLQSVFPVSKILSPYTSIDWVEISPGVPMEIDDGLVRVQCLAISNKRPRYAQSNEERACADSKLWVVGYKFTDAQTEKSIGYVPSVSASDDALRAMLTDCDYVFFDGTFWTDDELRIVSNRSLSAAATGHLPLSSGGLDFLSSCGSGRKLLVHINNTNPILDSESVEHKLLERAGVSVGRDGTLMEV